MRQPEGCATFELLVGAPGFEPGRSNGALCSTGRRGQPYPPDTRNLAESLGIEPSRASAWHVSSVLAYHLPHSPLAPGHGFEPRVTALETVSLTIGNPGVKLEESGGIE